MFTCSVNHFSSWLFKLCAILSSLSILVYVTWVCFPLSFSSGLLKTVSFWAICLCVLLHYSHMWQKNGTNSYSFFAAFFPFFVSFFHHRPGRGHQPHSTFRDQPSATDRHVRDMRAHQRPWTSACHDWWHRSWREDGRSHCPGTWTTRHVWPGAWAHYIVCCRGSVRGVRGLGGKSMTSPR